MGLVDLCTLLLHHGANMNSRTYRGLTSVHSAAMTNKTQVMELLLTHGARIDDPANNNNMSILDASYHGALKAVVYLLDKGVDINVPGISNHSPLCAAASYGRIGVVEELIRRGADLRHRDRNGWFNSIILFYQVMPNQFYFVSHTTVKQTVEPTVKPR